MKNVRIPLVTLAIALTAPVAAVTATAAPAPAKADTVATATNAPASTASMVWCSYRVTAYPSLTVRNFPSLSGDKIGSLSYGKIVIASQSVVYGSGYYWRQTSGGWAASSYLSKQSAAMCFS